MSELSKETLQGIIKISTDTGARMANAKRDFDSVMEGIQKSSEQQLADLLKEEK